MVWSSQCLIRILRRRPQSLRPAHSDLAPRAKERWYERMRPPHMGGAGCLLAFIARRHRSFFIDGTISDMPTLNENSATPVAVRSPP